jgi:hypothetical protein
MDLESQHPHHMATAKDWLMTISSQFPVLSSHFSVRAALMFVLIAPQATGQSASLRISDLGLSAAEQHQILAVVAPSAFDAPDSWEDELRAVRVDLGASPGIVVRGTKLLCGGTGNCQLFVLRKANGAWVSLFGNEQGPIAESYEFGPDVVQGIKDLTVTTNLGADAARTVKYRFNGQIYRAVP